MSTMQAYRIRRFGGPDVFNAENIDVPEPGRGEVLVRVRAASTHPVDNKTRAGVYPMIREDKLPYILGNDFAGVAERTDPDVSQWKQGDEAYGFVGQGRTRMRSSWWSIRPRLRMLRSTWKLQPPPLCRSRR